MRLYRCTAGFLGKPSFYLYAKLTFPAFVSELEDTRHRPVFKCSENSSVEFTALGKLQSQHCYRILEHSYCHKRRLVSIILTVNPYSSLPRLLPVSILGISQTWSHKACDIGL